MKRITLNEDELTLIKDLLMDEGLTTERIKHWKKSNGLDYESYVAKSALINGSLSAIYNAEEVTE